MAEATTNAAGRLRLALEHRYFPLARRVDHKPGAPRLGSRDPRVTQGCSASQSSQQALPTATTAFRAHQVLVVGRLDSDEPLNATETIAGDGGRIGRCCGAWLCPTSPIHQSSTRPRRRSVGT